MKKAVFMLLVGVVGVMLTACSSIDTGEVIDKEYIPPSTRLEDYCAAYDGQMKCIVWAQERVPVPEYWTVTFEGYPEKKGDKEPKAKRRTVRVKEHIYEMVSIGDEVSVAEKGYIYINNERIPVVD